jgi:hypothetical protein
VDTPDWLRQVKQIGFTVIKINRITRTLIACRPLWISIDSKVFFSLSLDKEHGIGGLNHASIIAGSRLG